MTTIIVPAIIPQSYEDLENKIGLIVGAASWVQVDVCDGKFVPSKSWPFEGDKGEFAKIVKEGKSLPHFEEIDYEVHLMTETPGDEVADWVRAGATRVIVHIEVGSDAIEDIISEWGQTVEIGIALRMETSISSVSGFLEKVKTFQLMGNEKIGFHGQKLDPRIYDRIKQLRELVREHIIAVDIGVNLENAKKLTEAGANKLIAGSVIWQSDDVRCIIEKFHQL